jgi:predicted nucleic acid-binding protein
MPATEFLDTNVLVYAYDPSNPRKRRAAQELLRRALAGGIVTSTQVLAECAATLLHKLAARPKDVADVLDVLGPIRLVVPDADLHLQGDPVALEPRSTTTSLIRFLPDTADHSGMTRQSDGALGSRRPS